MTEIADILSFMAQHGCAPRDGKIIIDDRKRRFTPADHKKPTGVYNFKFSQDGTVVGWFMDYRFGELHKYISRVKKSLTPEEKEAFKKRMNAERKARQREIEKDREAAKAKAARIWERATRGETGYTRRKKINPTGARVWNDLLVVPAYKEGRLVTVQLIAENGEKRFLSGGEKTGAYSSVGKDTSKIYVSEGFSTAKTVFEAMGGVSVWAFDAGNLIHVAKVLKEKYPESEIIICADNDQWKEENTGLIKGRAAAIAIGAKICYPDFPPDHAGKGTDFNDLACDAGIDAVKSAILAAREVGGGSGVVVVDNPYDPPHDFPYDLPDDMREAPPLDAYEEDVRHQIGLYGIKNPIEDKNWKEKLHYKEDGKLDPRSLNNASLFLSNAPPFNTMFCYDEFAHQKIIVQCPPWEDVSKFKPREKKDSDATWILLALEKKGIKLALPTLNKLLDATIERKRVNPAQEYFGSLKWDGVPRLDKWLTYYLGAEEDDPEYLAFVGRKWLTASVTRVFEPGSKFDHILILEGDQGTGKSTALKKLATIHGRKYFIDSIKISDLGTPSTISKLQGVLIVEFAEMAGLGRADKDTIKQQIVLDEDAVQRKFENEKTVYPRQFVFGASINVIDGYLDDATGDRRYWCVKTGDIDLKALEHDKDQLWAEAVYLYRHGEKIYMNAHERGLLEKAQLSRKRVSPWHEDLALVSRGRSFVSQQELWEAIGIDKDRRSARDAREISKIMVELGFVYERATVDGNRQYGWRSKR